MWGNAAKQDLMRVRRELIRAREQQQSGSACLLAWWEERRPDGWSAAQHRAHPRVNCCTRGEHLLAVLAVKIIFDP